MLGIIPKTGHMQEPDHTVLLFTEAFALFYANKNNMSTAKVNIPPVNEYSAASEGQR